MNTNLPSGILYSSRYFTEETLNFFLQNHSPKSKEVVWPTPSALTKADEEKAFASAWAALSRKMEFEQVVKERGITFDKALSDFQAGLAEAITPEFCTQVAESLDWGYKVKIQDDAFVHYMRGEPIVSIPVKLKSSKGLSDNFAFVMYIALATIDFVLICAACAGVSVAARPQTLFQRITGHLGGLIKWMSNPSAISRLARLLEQKDNTGIIILFLLGIRETVNVPDLVTDIVTGMEFWDKVIILAQIVASVVLAVATMGTSLTVKIVQLVAAFTLFLIDATGICQNWPRSQ